MTLKRVALSMTMVAMLAGSGWAQVPVQDMNKQENKDAQAQVKQDHKADKSQAKADKDEQKALKSKKVKKADKSQDKANDAADKAANP
jgi:hypothetical protein